MTRLSPLSPDVTLLPSGVGREPVRRGFAHRPAFGIGIIGRGGVDGAVEILRRSPASERDQRRGQEDRPCPGADGAASEEEPHRAGRSQNFISAVRPITSQLPKNTVVKVVEGKNSGSVNAMKIERAATRFFAKKNEDAPVCT